MKVFDYACLCNSSFVKPNLSILNELVLHTMKTMVTGYLWTEFEFSFDVRVGDGFVYLIQHENRDQK